MMDLEERGSWSFGVRVLRVGETRWRLGRFDPYSQAIRLRDGGIVERRQVRRIVFSPFEDDGALGRVGPDDLGWVGLLFEILSVPRERWADSLFGTAPRTPAPAMDQEEMHPRGRVAVSVVSLEAMREAELAAVGD